MVVRIHFDEAIVVLIGNQNVAGRIESISLGLGRECASRDESSGANKTFQWRETHDNPPGRCQWRPNWLEVSVEKLQRGIVSRLSKRCHFWALADRLAQLAAQKFARCGLRHGVDEANFARLLVVGEAVRHEGAEFIAKLLAIGESI